MMHLQVIGKVKKGFLLGSLMVVMSFLTVVYAQQGDLPQVPQQQEVKEDFTEEELKLFIKANEEASKVQQVGEQKMISSIENKGLDVDKFNEILMSKQNPEAEVQASEEELKKFDEASQEIMTIQQGLQQDVVKAVEGAGMDINKYGEMMLAYQNSTKVQKDVQKLLEAEAKEEN